MDGATGDEDGSVTKQPFLLLEDAPLELAQLWSRLDSQLLHEGSPRLLIRREGIRLSAGAVEREHVLGAAAFAKRRRGYEGLELCDKLGAVP